MHRLTVRTLLLYLLLSAASVASAQSEPAEPPASASAEAAPGGTLVEELRRELREYRRLIEEQRAETERLRAELSAQAQALSELRAEVRAGAAQPAPAAARDIAAGDSAANAPAQGGSTLEARVERAEMTSTRAQDAIARQLGNMTFSGDLRLRYETTSGLVDSAPTLGNLAALGNRLPTANRARLRARFNIRGRINDEFEWGLRLSTGDYADAISTNQTLGDFFNRKPIALDLAFVNYRPRQLPGFQLSAGKFTKPWAYTEMTLDNDINSEGLSESYTKVFKKSRLRTLSFTAWQLPFLERSPSVTLAAAESRRGGRDLALYGGQVRAEFGLSKHTVFRFSAADLFFSGTKFITPVQLLGDEVLLPVTVTLPATTSMPAQTVTGQARIPRSQLVSGGAELGLSTATNNALNRDGRLASGYNLVDLIGRLDLTQSNRYPVLLLFNFVTNTQARAVEAAGPGGAPVVMPNNERNGYWLESQVGRSQVRGDTLFSYTFMRIEKDAVLTPFNFSDLPQQSDVRAHRLIFAYTLDPRVILSATGIFASRANGLAGPFGTSPPDAFTRPTVRLQFDTLFRF